ncbi:MAG: ABC transporter permease [Actinomycetota bacterium]|nr:ABC transporter permease [Actinomycetota bacterium]
MVIGEPVVCRSALARLVRAEYRKIFSTKLWWGLLIPVVLTALLFNLAGSGFANLVADQPGEAELPFVPVTLGLTMGFTATFAAIFGALAVSSEHRHRTITTTLLTGSSRQAVFGAKLVAHSSIGLLYALATVLFGALGAGIGGGGLSDPGTFFTVASHGCLAVLLWTMLGIGVGSLIGNQVAAVLTLVLYSLIVEPLIGTLLTAAKIQAVTDYLPDGATSALTTDLAIRQFAGGAVPAELGAGLSTFASVPWWVGGLLLTGYTMLLVGLGAVAGVRRDIT